MNEFRLKTGHAGSVKCALYADNAGEPGDLITAMHEGEGQAVNGTGWETLSFYPTEITSGTYYWLAFFISYDGAAQYINAPDTGTTRYKYTTTPYLNFNFPDPAGSGFTANTYGRLVAGWDTTGGGFPTINFNPDSFTFSATQGEDNPPTQTLNISNSGSGDLNWDLSKTQSWLDLSPTSGTNTGSSTLSVNVAGMSAGTYNDTVTITASGASNTPQTVPVTLTINDSTGQKLLGADDATGTNHPAGYLSLSRFQAVATGTMNEFLLKTGHAGSVKCALYADNAGEPGDLITAMHEGEGQAVNGTGWEITSGTYYWLAFFISYDGAAQYINAPDTGTTRYKYTTTTYLDFNFPDPAGSDLAANTYGRLVAGWSALSLTITTTSLSNGTVDVPYYQTIRATGGSGSYTWSIISGSPPAGLSLDPSTGIISGTPTATGTSDFTVQVYDGSTTATKALSITVTCNLAVTGEGSQISPYLYYSGGAGNYTNLNSDDAELSNAYHQQSPAGGIHESCFNMQDISTSNSIDSVTLYIKLCAYSSGFLKPYVRISGSNYYGDVQTITGSGPTCVWYTKSQSWAINPATGQPWTQSELNNAEFGFWTNFGYYGCAITYMYLGVDIQE
jgi:hypothetical protein